MRTLAKTLEYLLVVGLGLAATYAFIAPVARGISDSFNHTAELVADPRSAVHQ